MEKTTECLFLTLIQSVKKTSLPLLSTANQLLAELISILIVSYHLVTKSSCYIHYYIDSFHICSDWTKFHLELVRLTDVFKNNGYPENFINNCLKVLLDNKYKIQEKVIAVPKKTLFLVLLYLGPLSLQTTTKLRKFLKGILNCCKLQIMFKSQNKLAKAFRLKDHISKELTSGVVYKFQCGLCNESYYGECVRHLNVRIGEHIGISPLTRKKVKPKGSAVSDHLLLCYHSPSFENFSVLTNENKKFL